MIMNEAAKKIIEKANQVAYLVQSTADKLKESDSPLKDGVKLLNQLGELKDKGNESQ